MRNLGEAVELVIESLLEHGEPIPESPSDAVEVLEVSLDAPTITISA